MLPTKKVTAFALGGALTVIAFWALVDVFMLLTEWPGPVVVASFVLLIGSAFAWIVPESAWRRLEGHLEAELEITPTDQGTVEIRGPVVIEESPKEEGP